MDYARQTERAFFCPPLGATRRGPARPGPAGWRPAAQSPGPRIPACFRAIPAIRASCDSFVSRHDPDRLRIMRSAVTRRAADWRSSFHDRHRKLPEACTMGFEQLAALKEQLAKRAKTPPPKTSETSKPNKPSRQHRPAAGEGARDAQPSQAKGAQSKDGQAKDGQAKGGQKPAQAKSGQARPAQHAKPARAKAPRPAPAPARPVDTKPTDPVVLTIRKLQNRFPQAFPKKPAPKVPLKVGIFKDLVAQAEDLALTEAELRDAIKIWCRGSRYWSCLVEAVPRVDLGGAAVGAVSAEDAVRARNSESNRAAKAARKTEQAEAPASASAETAQHAEAAPSAAAAAPEAAEAPEAPVAPEQASASQS
jgi:ProP effector